MAARSQEGSMVRMESHRKTQEQQICYNDRMQNPTTQTAHFDFVNNTTKVQRMLKNKRAIFPTQTEKLYF